MSSLHIEPAVARWLPQFEHAGLAFNLDPLLLAAICARESGGGVYLSPPGPTGTGDNGHGRGLMQIDDRAHPDFCAKKLPSGLFAWQDPDENIHMGASVLRAALDALKDEPAAVAAYNAGIGAARKILGLAAIQRQTVTQTITMLDSITTGRDYVSWVLARRDRYAANP